MSLPRPVKAVVFDMDGLMVDSEKLWWAACSTTSAEMGAEFPFEVFVSIIGLSAAASNERLVAHFGADFDMPAWDAAMRAEAQAMYAMGIALKTGVVELLDHLDQLGLPRAVATSSSRATLQASLDPHALTSRFQAIITRESVTQHKPHPAPYLAAAKALGVDPADCLALEDSHNGVRSASAAGMMTVMVPDLLDPTEEIRGLCVRVAADLHEVRGLLSD
ncbi:HAD family hydrolase [Phenylobacterium immobile]|uniref:HAD family hydrolase n=1 Tax=Phenylobacterium immobile TaxID=21 RepID=UPI000B30B652|nr:HAD family phosphatase [Phenylobacterium immobile]